MPVRKQQLEVRRAESLREILLIVTRKRIFSFNAWLVRQDSFSQFIVVNELGLTCANCCESNLFLAST